MASSCATVAWTLSPARIAWKSAARGPGLKVAVAPSENPRTMAPWSKLIDCTVTRCFTDSTRIALWIRRASPLGWTLAIGAVQHPLKVSAMTESRRAPIARSGGDTLRPRFVAHLVTNPCDLMDLSPRSSARQRTLSEPTCLCFPIIANYLRRCRGDTGAGVHD